MRQLVPILFVGALLLCGGGLARASDDAEEIYSSSQGDAVVRRTDSCNCGVIGPGQVLPDLVRISLSRWQPTSPATDLFAGNTAQCTTSNCPASFFRLQVVFKGLVNPPGTLGIGSGTAFDPFQFGPSPVFGFVDLDIDRDTDTGGDLPGVAPTRVLANAARFGVRPYRNSARAAVTGNDLYNPWNVEPQIARSGADFSLVMCGCFPVTVVSTSTPCPVAFTAGSTWVVQGRFFQRASGYQPASFTTGGSTIGAYDPVVRLRFSHSISDDRTTVTLVFPIDQIGAQQALGLGQTPVLNTSVADAASVQEGLHDLIARAQQTGGMAMPTRLMIQRWASKNFDSVRNPTRWIPTAIFGTSYAQPTDAVYVWTDVGPEMPRGDVTGDREVNASDANAVSSALDYYDGRPGFDADATINGRIVIPSPGAGFNLFDRNGDGVINVRDTGVSAWSVCAADFDRDGVRSVADIFAFLSSWFIVAPAADVDGSGTVAVSDIFAFLGLWFAGCV